MKMDDVLVGITGNDDIGWQFDGQEFGTRGEAAEAAWADAIESVLKGNVDLFGPDVEAETPWTVGMGGFMRPGRAIWYAPKGEGKSMAALVAAVDVVAAGGEVVYIDLENGRRRTRKRLESILADRPAEVREAASGTALRYMDRFDFRTLTDKPNAMAAWLNELEEADLLVLDSFARILAQLGLNEESNPAVQEFVTTYIDPIMENERTAVVVLDNTGHAEGGRPRGASAKEDLFELAYRVSGGQRCSEKKHGVIKFKRTRHRDGDELIDMALGAGGGRYTQIVAPDNPATRLLGEVVDALEGQCFDSKNALYSAVKDAGIKTAKQTFYTLIDEWVEDQDSGIETNGDGGYEVVLESQNHQVVLQP